MGQKNTLPQLIEKGLKSSFYLKPLFKLSQHLLSTAWIGLGPQAGAFHQGDDD
jgi:hypothetical protein